MEFETISGTKYEVEETQYGIFLKRKSNHPIKDLNEKSIDNSEEIVYKLIKKPKVIVGSGVIINILLENNKELTFKTSNVVSSYIY